MSITTKRSEEAERRRRSLVSAIKLQEDSDYRDACEELFKEMEEDGTLEKELEKSYAVQRFFESVNEKLERMRG